MSSQVRYAGMSVRVGSDLGVESLGTEVRQVLKSDLSAGGHIDELVPLALHQLEVVSVLVQVTTSGRGVAVVLVVRATDAVAELSEGTSNSRSRRAANGPGSAVTIERGSKDSQENSKDGTHPNAVRGSIDKLWDGGISVVWEEAVVGHGITV